MEMKPAKSSNISELGYDDNTKELHVKFKHGNGVYVYKDVPKETFDKMTESESLGKFLNTEIKNVFLFDKVEADKDEK